MPVPPYTIHFQPSSSGTILVGRVTIPRPFRSEWCVCRVLGGPDRISSQQGITNTPCLDGTSIPRLRSTKTLHPGIFSSHMHPPLVPIIGDAQVIPPGKTRPTTHRKILPDRLNHHHTPKTHAKISPVVATLLAPSVLITHIQSSTKHHITDIMHSRSSSK